THTLTLASSVSRAHGAPVYLYKKSDGVVVLNGSAPDIGAFPFVPMEPLPVSLVANPTNVRLRGTEIASWSNFTPTGNDWISMHAVGTPDSVYVALQCLSGLPISSGLCPGGDSDTPSGTLSFGPLTTSGIYEFRFLPLTTSGIYEFRLFA